MDGRQKNQLPSMKTPQIMDGRQKNQLPSMKITQIMDGRGQLKTIPKNQEDFRG